MLFYIHHVSPLSASRLHGKSSFALQYLSDFIGDFYTFSNILQTITEYRSVYMPLVLLPSVHLLGRYLLQPALCQFCFPKLPMYKMIVAYMIVYFIYILLSNSCQGTITKNGYGYPAIGSRWGISIQIWVPMPRSQLSLGYFCANMGVYTPLPTFTGVFLCKYGCLYPAANFHRGIFVQIWASVPRSQLSRGYFCANMGVCTPLPAPAGVFLCKYGRLYPAACSRRGISAQKWISIPRHACPLPKLPHSLANPPHFLNSILIHAISNRRRRLTAVLSQHRTYRSVYGAFNS